MPTKLKLFQLYDLTAEAVLGPIMALRKEGAAVREFHAVLGMKDSQPGRYPEQFNLLLVGEQDESTGVIIGQSPEIIATGTSWLAVQNRGESDLRLVADRGSPLLENVPVPRSVAAHG